MGRMETMRTMVPCRKPHFCISAVLFDLDGTLIDSINVYYKVVETVFEKLNLPPVSRGHIYAAVDDGRFRWDRVLPADNVTGKDEIILRSMKLARKIYPDIFRREVDFFQGVPKLLAGINALGIKVGIVTATPSDNMAEKNLLLKRKGVSPYIETIVTNDDAPNPKPAPDSVLECCRRLAVEPQTTLFVGDTGVDIRAGKAAGTMTVAVLTGFDDRETLDRETPDAILNQVTDLDGMFVKMG